MNFDELTERLDRLERSLDVGPSSSTRKSRPVDRRLLDESHQLEANTQTDRVLTDIEVFLLHYYRELT